MENTKQVGGDHYQKYKIQPLTWALENDINAAEFSILRYVLRYKDKNGLEDLQKAIHYAEVCQDNKDIYVFTTIPPCKVSAFCQMNGLSRHQSFVLHSLFKQGFYDVKAYLRIMAGQL